MITKEHVRQYMNYAIICVVSIVACFFLPMLGSNVGIENTFPTTKLGWVVWCATKLCIAILNIIIFHSFMQQAKINVSNDPKYIEANDILLHIDKKEYIPRSPGKYNLQQYGSKGTTIFISSIVSAFALSEAILTFDWVQFLSYVFTVLMGVVFGIIQMRSSEVYWTTEYWKYAKYTENKVKEEREVSNGDKDQLQ